MKLNNLAVIYMENLETLGDIEPAPADTTPEKKSEPL